MNKVIKKKKKIKASLTPAVLEKAAFPNNQFHIEFTHKDNFPRA